MWPASSLLNLAAFGVQVQRRECGVHLYLRGARSVPVYLSCRVVVHTAVLEAGLNWKVPRDLDLNLDKFT